MSVLRLYEDEALTLMLSLEGDWSRPDEEASVDGTLGETRLKPLWAAVEQSVLAAEVSDPQAPVIQLAAPRFADPSYSVLLIGAEKLLVTGGHGSATLTVVRGHNGTTAAAHPAGTPVRLAYDCTAVSLDCADTQGPDESGWIGYCDDLAGSPSGVWEAPHALPNLPGAGRAALWRRLVVPTGTPAGYKQDLVHRLACTVNETA